MFHCGQGHFCVTNSGGAYPAPSVLLGFFLPLVKSLPFGLLWDEQASLPLIMNQ